MQFSLALSYYYLYNLDQFRRLIKKIAEDIQSTELGILSENINKMVTWRNLSGWTNSGTIWVSPVGGEMTAIRF